MLRVEALLLTEAPLARDALLLREAEELADPRRPLSGVLLVLEAPDGDADGDLDILWACRPPPPVVLPPLAVPGPADMEDGLAEDTAMNATGRGLRDRAGTPC